MFTIWISTPPARKYGDVFLRAEQEFSAFNFEHANTEALFRHFSDAESECQSLIAANLALPAYDQCIKASHTFNLLDARCYLCDRASGLYSPGARSCQGVLRNLAGRRLGWGARCLSFSLNISRKKFRRACSPELPMNSSACLPRP